MHIIILIINYGFFKKNNFVILYLLCVAIGELIVESEESAVDPEPVIDFTIYAVNFTLKVLHVLFNISTGRS